MPEFVTVAQTADVPQGEMLLVELEDEDIAIANIGGTYYAFGAECTHAGGPLDEGDLEGETLTCPWHGGQFDVKTGEVLGPASSGGYTHLPSEGRGDRHQDRPLACRIAGRAAWSPPANPDSNVVSFPR